MHRQLPDRPAVRDRIGRVLGQDLRLVRRNHRIDLYRPPRVRRRHVHLRTPKVRLRDNLPRPFGHDLEIYLGAQLPQYNIRVIDGSVTPFQWLYNRVAISLFLLFYLFYRWKMLPDDDSIFDVTNYKVQIVAAVPISWHLPATIR